MGKVVVIGSSNTDMVVKTKRFPLPGETLLGGDFFMFPGGKGANQAVAAARIGGDVTFICKLGNDVFGQKAKTEFAGEKIHTAYVLTDNHLASGTALILVNEHGENEIVVAPGANNSLSENDIIRADVAMQQTDIILMQLEVPLSTIAYAAKRGFEFGKRVILNPAPAQSLPAELYYHLFLITPNETEASLLTGIRTDTQEGVEEAAKALLARGVKNVIVTLGALGAYFRNDKESFLVASPQVKAMDTTAAGDVFNGALAVELSNNKDWKSAMEIASKAAAISVTRMGAQSSAPKREEVLTYKFGL